ncbi:MAG: FHA domain-containing protein [Blastochloris sp.]|nr:FHA domain-containing protein [Blastochloris sp.]
MAMLIRLFENQPESALPFPLLEKALLLGRNADCSIRLNHPSVSRSHAKLHQHENQWYIQDLNSSNGTYLNGHRCETNTLREGDIVNVGDFSLVFSERNPDAIPVMYSWLERVGQKAIEIVRQIHQPNTISPQPSHTPSPLTAKTPPVPIAKVIRAKPSDILTSAAFEKTGPVSTGFPFTQTKNAPAPQLKRLPAPKLPPR